MTSVVLRCTVVFNNYQSDIILQTSFTTQYVFVMTFKFSVENINYQLLCFVLSEHFVILIFNIKIKFQQIRILQCQIKYHPCEHYQLYCIKNVMSRLNVKINPHQTLKWADDFTIQIKQISKLYFELFIHNKYSGSIPST